MQEQRNNRANAEFIAANDCYKAAQSFIIAGNDYRYRATRCISKKRYLQLQKRATTYFRYADRFVTEGDNHFQTAKLLSEGGN